MIVNNRHSSSTGLLRTLSSTRPPTPRSVACDSRDPPRLFAEQAPSFQRHRPDSVRQCQTAFFAAIVQEKMNHTQGEDPRLPLKATGVFLPVTHEADAMLVSPPDWALTPQSACLPGYYRGCQFTLRMMNDEVLDLIIV